MDDAGTVIEGIFSQAEKDDACKGAVEALRRLHAGGGWDGPRIAEVVSQELASEDRQG